MILVFLSWAAAAVCAWSAAEDYAVYRRPGPYPWPRGGYLEAAKVRLGIAAALFVYGMIPFLALLESGGGV